MFTPSASRRDDATTLNIGLLQVLAPHQATIASADQSPLPRL